MTEHSMPTAESRRPVSDQVFGDNKAPIEEVLKADFADMQKAFADLVEESKRLPNPIKTDADQTKVGAWIVKARAYAKRADEVRTDENKPILAAQRGINNFFKSMLDDTAMALVTAQGAADKFVRQKEAGARAAAQKEAEAARQKAEEERLRAESLKRPDAIGRAEGRAEELDAVADAAEERALAAAKDLTRHRAGSVTSGAKQGWSWEFTDKDAVYASLGPLGDFIAEAAITTAINSMVRAQKARTKLPGIKVFEKTTANFRG